MPHPASHSDPESSAERADFVCSHALSQVALAAASACRLRAPRRTVEAPARPWPHGETHGFACRSGCAGRLVASDGFAAISASARVRCCHRQRLVMRPAGAAARDRGRCALGRQSPVRQRAIVAGSVRALPWADDAAVKSALVVRAERNAAPCGAPHAAVAVEDRVRATVGSAASAGVSAGGDRRAVPNFWCL
jgi:hypothetical protein